MKKLLLALSLLSFVSIADDWKLGNSHKGIYLNVSEYTTLRVEPSDIKGSYVFKLWLLSVPDSCYHGGTIDFQIDRDVERFNYYWSAENRACIFYVSSVVANDRIIRKFLKQNEVFFYGGKKSAKGFTKAFNQLQLIKEQ
ncbi:hypothetical protein [Shewanella kaireitica]|uniref:hypothetical protein n=1 Tax=Shewanella kaireitica TaxID=212021 RepID=UPI00200FE879|nr:hypothetical protein [Shewanella kaireitica]MCL1092783.1 hypothetical protein [Shewanella kaireitica]